jgi:hypothetical protein
MGHYCDTDSPVRRLGGCDANGIYWLMEVNIEPWLLWVRNEQAFPFQPANYNVDHLI